MSEIQSLDREYERIPSRSMLKSRGFRRSILIIVLLAVLVAAGWVILFLIAQLRPIYVVNGTPVAYDVRIGSRDVHLTPYGVRKVSVGEGVRTVRITSGPAEGKQFTVQMRTPVFNRVFQTPIFVINPDETAILTFEQSRYSLDALKPGYIDPDYEFKYHLGKTLYAFEDVEFPFKSLPDEIWLDSGDSATRRSVGLLTRPNPESVAWIASTELSEDTATAFFWTTLEYAPGEGAYLTSLEYLVEPGELVAYLEPLLSERPVQLDVHVVYQDAVQRAGADVDLEGMYRAYLVVEPDEVAVWQYLLSRVMSDELEAGELHRAAAAQPDAPQRVRTELRDWYRYAGNFQPALELAQMIQKQDPANETERWATMIILCALGRYNDALQAVRELQELDPTYPDYLEVELLLRGRLGTLDESEVSGRIAELVGLADAEGSLTVSMPDAAHRLKLVYHYAVGDHITAARHAAQRPEYFFQFIAHMLRGKLAEAETTLTVREEGDAQDYMTLALVAHQNGDEDMTARCIERANILMNRQGGDEAALGRWISVPATLTVADVRYLAVDPTTKALAVTLVGLRDPELRTGCYAVARHFNYRLYFPHHLIRDIAGE